MTAFISAIVCQCSKGWQYKNDKSSCLFNAKLILSLLFWMNIAATVLLIAGKRKGLELCFYNVNGLPVSIPIIILTFYILLSILFPKKKVFNAESDETTKKKYLRKFFSYVAFSILYMIAAGVLSK